MEKKLGREPDLRELSDAMDMPMEELAMTLESVAEVDSIYKTVYQGDGTDLQLVLATPPAAGAYALVDFGHIVLTERNIGTVHVGKQLQCISFHSH